LLAPEIPGACCSPAEGEDFCECGPTCPAGDDADDGGPCLCGVCVDDATCDANDDLCTENCLYATGGTVPNYLALQPSPAWLALYDASLPTSGTSGAAEVQFGKGGQKKVCLQYEMTRGSGDDRVLDVVKKDGGCRARQEGRNKLNPEIRVALPFVDDTEATNPAYSIAVHTSCSKPILFLGAQYTQNTGDENYVVDENNPELDPETDVFLTLVGFCVLPGNKAENLQCSGDVPQIPDASCPEPGGPVSAAK